MRNEAFNTIAKRTKKLITRFEKDCQNLPYVMVASNGINT